MKRLLLAGAVATAIMTMMMYKVAPIMLGKPMDIAAKLGAFVGGDWNLGMMIHLLNGLIIFPLLYGFLVYKFLPGPSGVRGAVFGVLLWLGAMLVVMPLMGDGFFMLNSGTMKPAMASFMGHLLYGVALGAISGKLSE